MAGHASPGNGNAMHFDAANNPHNFVNFLQKGQVRDDNKRAKVESAVLLIWYSNPSKGERAARAVNGRRRELDCRLSSRLR